MNRLKISSESSPKSLLIPCAIETFLCCSNNDLKLITEDAVLIVKGSPW